MDTGENLYDYRHIAKKFLKNKTLQVHIETQNNH
jgi:hypothetical protein